MSKLRYLCTVNYVEINICCIIIIVVLGLIAKAYMKRLGKNLSLMVIVSGICFSGYMLIDAVLALAEYNLVIGAMGAAIATELESILIILGSVAWFGFVSIKAEYDFSRKLAVQIALSTPAIFIIVMHFVAGENAIFSALFEYVSFAYVLIASIMALFAARLQWGEKKIHVLIMALFAVPIVLMTEVGELFQINTEPVGYLIGYMILFYYDIMAMAIIHSKDERLISAMKEQLRAQDKEHKDMAMFESLAKDFSSVMYVMVNGKNENDLTEPFPKEDPLIKILPGWNEERSFFQRLNLLMEYAIPKEDREDFLEKIDKDLILMALIEDSVYYLNFRTVIDGEKHYYQLKFTPNTTGEGKIHGVVVGIKCVDSEVESREEMQRMEAEQIAMKAFTNLFIDYYISAYYINMADATFTVYKRSSEIEDNYGSQLDYNVFINKYIDKCVHEADRDMMRANTAFSYIRERLKNVNEYSVVYRDIAHGDIRYFKMQVIKGHDDIHIAEGFTDITKEIENELRVQAMLEEANKAKTTFLFNMSHDIRTPMNAIIGFTDLAQKHSDNREKVEDYLGKIEMAGNHLLQLINEVLDMSRIESGKVHSEIKQINLLDSFSVLYTVCRENADEKGVELEWITKDIEHQLIEADELHVNQVLMNVISNAVKYTMEGGKVTCLTQELKSDRDGFARFLFRVEDNGIGMSQDFLEHIFDSFSREENSVVSGIQGTGLGMSIVKRLVDLLEGNIVITSEAGVGTCVDITFDFKVQSAEETEGSTSKSEAVSLVGSRVLLVEDNELNREIATEMLTDEGLIIEEAVNGQDAVNIVSGKGMDYYDFILMDIQMPIMNGFEATAAIRAMEGGDRVTIIALSANAFEEDRQRSIAAGMNDHIAKPIQLNKLMETMANLVKR